VVGLMTEWLQGNHSWNAAQSGDLGGTMRLGAYDCDLVAGSAGRRDLWQNESAIGLIYKTSFDKANRTSVEPRAASGSRQALPIFAEIREASGLPVLTDVHEADQCAPVAAGRRRAADPGLPVPPDRPACWRRPHRQGRQRQEGPVPGALGHEERDRQDRPAPAIPMCWCERGASFGYNTLVSTCAPADHGAQTGCPVVFDATHSVQQPGGQGETRADSGNSCRCWRAPRCGRHMIPLSAMPAFVAELVAFDRLAKSLPLTIF
jgi:2-dehydro-3-deoxyphosphooctonate aldolase (KDO 8-P synthase)